MADYDIERPTYDNEKQYEYTWPGCKPTIVCGEELNALLKGADHTKLNIREVRVLDARITHFEANVTVDTPGGHTVEVPEPPEQSSERSTLERLNEKAKSLGYGGDS
jgi:hypothetical protein